MLILNQSYDPAVPVGILNLHPDNPREGNVGLITQSIETIGFYGAVVAQKSTSFILAGNHRYRSALENEATTMPVIWVDVPDDIALRILLVDNKAADDASNNEPALADLLRGLMETTGTLDGTGYSPEELDDLISGLNAADNQPAAGEKKDPPPAPGDPGENRYKEQYAVIVVCATEVEQEATYNRLVGEGFNCKVVST
jgi:hypothetical protein